MSRIARLLFLLSALMGPVLLHGQFQKPTEEELKMTSDPKAPGADAVILNVVETADNFHHYESFYARIKVLTEKGKELATVELPYIKDEAQREVAAVQGRTIHADGTIIPLVGKPEDILIEKKKSVKLARKVFTLPSVEVGSILEYYYQYRYSDAWIFPPDWEIQRPYLVRKAHFVFTPDSSDRNFRWWSVLPVGMSVTREASGRYTLDLTDIPPAPKEDWMPPIDSFLYKVKFFYGVGANIDDYWKSESSSWSQSVDRFVDPSKAFREVVKGLVAGDDTDLMKASKLYKAVQGLDNTDFSREKGEVERRALKLKDIKRAEDVWKEKSGTRTEIALLYLSMLRAAGLTANAIRVSDRSLRTFAPNYLDYDQLDDTLVILTINGKEMLLDPGEKMCPFLETHWRHSLASGIRQGSSGAVATTPMQPYSENKVIRNAELTMDDQGNINGTINLSLNGQQALYWRQRALEVDAAELQKQFVEWIQEKLPDGVVASLDHMDALDNPDSTLVGFLKVTGSLGTFTSKRVLLPASFFETRGHRAFVDEEKRLAPIDMHYGEQTSDKVTYHLASNLSMEGTPQETKESWSGHMAFVSRILAAPHQITSTRSLARAFSVLPAADYKDLRDFYLKVAANDQQQIVLSRAAAGAKGN